MKTLKILLWILGILLLLGFVESFVPWSILENMAEPFGVDISLLPQNAVLAYAMRTMMLSCGLIGVFLFVMAKDPKKYKNMISLVAVVLAILGAYMFLLIVFVYEFKGLWYYFDPIFLLVWAGWILKEVKKA